jgi:hypothetical protein
VHISRKAVEPRYDERAAGRLCLFQRSGKTWPQQQCVSTGSGLHILMPCAYYKPLPQPEPLNIVSLGIES